MIDLYLGDCLEIMKNIPDNSVDLILCDLPYGTTNCKWDSVLDLTLLWESYKRIRKPTTPIILFAQSPFDKILGYSNIEELRYEWIWEKTQATGHLNAKKMPMKAHENILVFYEKLPVYNPIKTTGHVRKQSSANSRNKCIKRRIDNVGDDYLYGVETETVDYDSTERYPRSVIKYKSDKQLISLHPTQKPVELLEYLIKTYSNEGDVVLDNTMGSGSTGVACINTNRRFIGIEKDEKYYYISKSRLNSIK